MDKEKLLAKELFLQTKKRSCERFFVETNDSSLRTLGSSS